ncbi:hypothetical protein [Mycolicibacterium sp.]|uniref:hypothetical protein n=1 Tax=Mycolicibacterium sp. TaxID=2320850 RepID=UPI003D098F10
MPTRQRARAQATAAYIKRQRQLNAVQRPLDMAALAAEEAEHPDRRRRRGPDLGPQPPRPPRRDYSDEPPPF